MPNLPLGPHTHEATVAWQRDGAVFVDRRYSRAHRWRFDGGVEVPASASPHVVPVPHSDPRAVDPEEALVAAASSCHMLTFLSLAATEGFVVDAYEDHAVGRMGRDARGRMAIVTIRLRPTIRFAGEKVPDQRALAALHEAAHEQCFIASSLTTEIVVEQGPVA